PIGQHLLLPVVAFDRPPGSAASSLDREIVGVQADAVNDGPGHAVQPEIVLPFAQNPQPSALVAVRTAGGALPQTAIADIVRSLDPTLPLARVQTIEETLRQSTASDR